MTQIAILYPVFALALWTILVLCLIPVMRFRAAAKGEASVKDYRYGESSTVPGYVSLPNRNYMNLLEMPVLFYVACLLIFVTASNSATLVNLAWAYVATRIIHSAIHLSYNNVMHRLAAFAASNLVLIALWVVTALHVLGNVPA